MKTFLGYCTFAALFALCYIEKINAEEAKGRRSKIAPDGLITDSFDFKSTVLKDTYCSNIAESPDGRLWFSTNEGFDLLSGFEKVDFGVIFTTAYQEYAIRAFRFSAIDYLLKPIDPDELQTAVGKFRERVESVNPEQLRILQEQLDPVRAPRLVERKRNDHQRIALPTAEGILQFFFTHADKVEGPGV